MVYFLPDKPIASTSLGCSNIQTIVSQSFWGKKEFNTIPHQALFVTLANSQTLFTNTALLKANASGITPDHVASL